MCMVQRTPERIKELAAQAPVYQFGSPELSQLHADNREAFRGVYKSFAYEVYVVDFPSCRGNRGFRTLNIIRGGQRVPEIHDIPE